MSGLRERLVEALGKHFISKGHENHWRGERVYVASPMVDVNDLVDVLLSLPGIAVVDIERSAQAIWQTYAVETGRSLPAGLADKLALAAADAAESVTP